MKTLFVSALLLAALTAVASAESNAPTAPASQSTQYLGLGVQGGGLRVFSGGLYVDGGYRVDGGLFAHAQISAGGSGSDGDYEQARVGVEGRGCVWGERICGFAGIDVGYQHDHVVDEPWSDSDSDPYVATAHDVIAVPRLGFELGAPIKLRTSLELPLYQAIAGDTPMTDDGEQRRNGVGAMLSMSLGYSF